MAEQGARIKIELGYVYSDLSRHDLCLKYMDEAEKVLKNEVATGICKDIRRGLIKKVWYCSGVSHSVLGCIDDCIDYYSRIVKDAAEQDSYTPLDALTLGYLGYELRFVDSDKSEKWGTHALELSRKLGDKNTIIKNMCSLGQTLLFSRKMDEGRQLIEETDELYTGILESELIDKREIGRILINSSVNYIFKHNWNEADERLKKGYRLTHESGDRRRTAMAIAYQAIILYKQGIFSEAKLKMMDAIQQHLNITARREVIFETLSYIWMIDTNFDIDLKHIHKRSEFPTEIQNDIKRIFQEEKLYPFVEFWVKRYKPLLLES